MKFLYLSRYFEFLSFENPRNQSIKSQNNKTSNSAILYETEF